MSIDQEIAADIATHCAARRVAKSMSIEQETEANMAELELRAKTFVRDNWDNPSEVAELTIMSAMKIGYSLAYEHQVDATLARVMASTETAWKPNPKFIAYTHRVLDGLAALWPSTLAALAPMLKLVEGKLQGMWSVQQRDLPKGHELTCATLFWDIVAQAYPKEGSLDRILVTCGEDKLARKVLIDFSLATDIGRARLYIDIR